MKKRLRILSLAVVFCMLLTLSACSGRTDVENGDSYIFGLNADRTGLIKVSYDISQEETGDAAEAMLEELKKSFGGDRIYRGHSGGCRSAGVRAEGQHPRRRLQQGIP